MSQPQPPVINQPSTSPYVLPSIGTLAAAKAPVFVTPSGYATRITSWTLTNTDTASRTVNLWLTYQGVSQRLFGKDVALLPTNMVTSDSEVYLPAGSTIEGNASAAAVVSYVITGELILL